MRVWDAFDTAFSRFIYVFYSIVTLWCLIITHKTSVCLLRKTHYFSVTAVMAREIINVHLKNDVKIINTFCGQYERLLKFEDGVICSKTCAM